MTAGALAVSLGGLLLAAAGPAAASTGGQVILPFTGLSGPRSVKVGADGAVYVADGENDRVVELPPLLLAQPGDITVDATGPSGAAVSYDVPAVTDTDDAAPPAASCTPPSGSVFPIGTTTVTCTVTDPNDTPTTASTSFTVTVNGAATQLSALATAVQGTSPDTSLSSMITRTQADLAANNTTAACAMLDAFINQVKAQAGKSIPAATAATLIASARQIQAVLAC